jgi:tRNA1(Val) A37 N6-methylase TrmN6
MESLEGPSAWSRDRSGEFEFITGREWRRLSADMQESYIDRAFRFWRREGFPYFSLGPDEIRNEFRRLRNVRAEGIFLPGDELQYSSVGLALANSFHPQMWSVPFERHRTPLQCFEDDILLKACLRRALSLWPTKRGASPSVLRDMLRTFRHTRRVSNFRPAVAKALYERYSSDNDRVLDFSAGYGGRLLACLTLRREYVGYDPCRLQIRGLRRMSNALRAMSLTSACAHIRQVCAEDAIRDEDGESFHLIFTSPPYFDREKYSEESTQSFLRYNTYSRWRDHFLAVVIGESARVLKAGGFLVLNVADLENAPVATDAREIALRALSLVKVYLLRLSVLPYARNDGSGPWRYEPVYVFQKDTSGPSESRRAERSRGRRGE